MCWASAWPWLLLLFLLSLCLSSNIGESQDSPPQDCPLGGQSWGGEYWYPGISTLPTLVITLFFCYVCLYHAFRIVQTQSLISFFIFGTSWTLKKTFMNSVALYKQRGSYTVPQWEAVLLTLNHLPHVRRSFFQVANGVISNLMGIISLKHCQMQFTHFIRKVLATKILLSGKFSFFLTLHLS